jgi:single-strand DNA-binding protein
VYQYVKKGQRVYVTGRLTYGEITDAEGVNRQTTAILAEDVIFMSSPKA